MGGKGKVLLEFLKQITFNIFSFSSLLQAQIGLLVILLVAIADFMIGSFIGPKSDEERAKGFLGYNSMCQMPKAKKVNKK